MSKQQKTTKSKHHFFATNSSYWETGHTKEEAIQKLLDRTGKNGVAVHIEHFGYMSFNVMKVHTAYETPYKIQDRRPVGFEISDFEQWKVTDTKGTMEPLVRP